MNKIVRVAGVDVGDAPFVTDDGNGVVQAGQLHFAIRLRPGESDLLAKGKKDDNGKNGDDDEDGEKDAAHGESSVGRKGELTVGN